MTGADDRSGGRGTTRHKYRDIRERRGIRERQRNTRERRQTGDTLNRLVVALLLVSLSFGVFTGLLWGTSTGTAAGVAAADCTSDAGNSLVWHFERYGTGCQGEFVRYPEGEQIDQVGEPPWAPL